MKDFVSSPVSKLQDTIKSTFNTMLAAEGQMKNAFASTNQNIQKQTSVLDNLKSGAMQLVGGLAAGAIIKEIVTAGTQMEQTMMSYETLLYGNKELAKQTTDSLKNFAKITAFSNTEVLEAGQSLLGFGVQAQKLLPTVQTLGDLSMGNANKFKSLVDNYGKW